MKNINYIIILFFAMICYSSIAQNKLTGNIKSAKDSSALSGVIIYFPDLKTGAVSKSDGSYKIENMPKGTFLVEARLVGYATVTKTITVIGNDNVNFRLKETNIDMNEVVITGNSLAKDNQHSPAIISEVPNSYLLEHSSTNVIDALAETPGVSAITNAQSISKPVIRGLGYNRVITLNDGVEQIDQPWFDEFGIEADPDAVYRAEILKGPASLAYGSDAISGVINLIPEMPLAPGEMKGDVMMGYQTNNGLINNMIHMAGNNNGIAWSGRIDNIMAHSYQNPNDGYVINSQFSNFNTDGTIGIHRKWGYSQLHASYFRMETGIVDGTRDSATGKMVRPVSYPDFNDGEPSYELPTKQEQKSYTPFVINQIIQHTKFVWDNSVAVGNGRITGIFSYQKNQRQELNDPTIPNTADIYYYSDAFTYDVRYLTPQMGGFNLSVGTNGVSQNSKSLGTLMLIPDYNLFQIGGFAIANEKLGKLNLSGGIRFDNRKFTGVDHWVDTTDQAPVDANSPNSIHEFHGFTSNFSGVSGSIGATYDINKSIFVKANIARGFRAPNVAECGANGVHDGTPVYELGDNNIKQETSLEEDFALGINHKDISFEIDLFNNSITNFIYAQGLKSTLNGDSINNSLNAVGLGSAPVYKYVNGDARLYGGEASLTIHPTSARWIEFNSTFSMVDGGLINQPDSVKHLPFIPPTSVTAELKFHLNNVIKGIKNAYIKFGIMNCSQQSHIYEQSAIFAGLPENSPEFIASRAATKGYTLFNAGLGGNFTYHGNDLFQLYVICNNLFNTAYIDYMSRFKYLPVNNTTGRVGVFNMGRNLSLKMIVPLNFTWE